MLINCKPGCVGKKVTTTASLDVETNDVVCDFCGETIAVSSFVKTSMKQRGDIVRKDDRKSFQFDCETCGKLVQTEVKGIKLVGKGCTKGGCKFNVSKFTIHAMKNISAKQKQEEVEDEEDEEEINE